MDNFLNFFYSYLDKNQRKKIFILNNRKDEIVFFNNLNKKIIEKINKNMIYKEIYFFKKCNITDKNLIENIKQEVFSLFENNLNTVLNNYFTLFFCENISKDIDTKLHTVSCAVNDINDFSIVPVENNFYFEHKNYLNIKHFLNSYYENKMDIFAHSSDNLTVNSLSFYYINDFDFFFIDYIDKCIRFVFNKYSIIDNYYLKDSHLIEDKKLSTGISTYISNIYIDCIFELKLETFKNIFDYFDIIKLNNRNYYINEYNKFNFYLSDLFSHIEYKNCVLHLNDKIYTLDLMDEKSIIKLKNEINSLVFKNIDFKLIFKEKTYIEDLTKVYGFYFSLNSFFIISKKNYTLLKNEMFYSSHYLNDLINNF